MSNSEDILSKGTSILGSPSKRSKLSNEQLLKRSIKKLSTIYDNKAIGPLEATIIYHLNIIRTEAEQLTNIIIYRIILDLESSLSLEDLQTFCISLNVVYDNLSGETKSAKIRSLVLGCYQEGKIDVLLSEFHRLRPRR